WRGPMATDRRQTPLPAIHPPPAWPPAHPLHQRLPTPLIFLDRLPLRGTQRRAGQIGRIGRALALVQPEPAGERSAAVADAAGEMAGGGAGELERLGQPRPDG